MASTNITPPKAWTAKLKERVDLPIGVEHDGERFIVGSKGGAAAHPLWFLNLRAEPKVHVRVDAKFYPAIAEVLAADERTRIWPIPTKRYEMFADYQSHTVREIPLIRLRPMDRSAD